MFFGVGSEGLAAALCGASDLGAESAGAVALAGPPAVDAADAAFVGTAAAPAVGTGFSGALPGESEVEDGEEEEGAGGETSVDIFNPDVEFGT